MNKLLPFFFLLLFSLTGQAQEKDSLSGPALFLQTEAIRRLPPDIKKAERAVILSRKATAPLPELSSLLDESLRIAARFERADVVAFLYLAKARMEAIAKETARAQYHISQAENLMRLLGEDSATALKQKISDLNRIYNLPGKPTRNNTNTAPPQQRPLSGRSNKDPVNLSGKRQVLNHKKEFKAAYQQAVRLASESGDKELLHSTQIVYASNLVAYGSKVEGVRVYKALAADVSVSEQDRVHILCQLVINLFKLNIVAEANSYYSRLQELVETRERNIDEKEYWLATAMYHEYHNQVLQAKQAYLKLVDPSVEPSLFSVEGTVRLAALYSRAYQQDSADAYFEMAGKQVKQMPGLPFLQYEYDLAYQSHRDRFKKQGAMTDSLLLALVAQDSLYRQELVAVTRELGLKNQVLESSQRARQAEQQRQIETLKHARTRQQFWLAVLVLGLVAVSALLISYIVFQRRRQAALLHKKELEMLEQKHRSEVLQTLSRAQESERGRIAGQLHDEIGSMLSVARLNLSSLRTVEGKAVNPIAAKLDTADKLLGDISVTIREMSHQLMPVALKKYGLKKAIYQLVSDINAAGRLYVEDVMVGLDNTDKLSEDFKVGVYRIVQEILQNVVKHSGAGKALVQIVEHEDLVSIVVEDNGKGICPHEDKTGMGLQLLQSRVAYLEGKMVIENGPDGGALVSIELPLRNNVT